MVWINRETKPPTIFLQGIISMESGEMLGKALEELADGEEGISIDFAEVKAIDSVSIGKVIQMQKHLMEQKRSIRFVNVRSAFLREMFAMMCLDKIIPMG